MVDKNLVTDSQTFFRLAEEYKTGGRDYGGTYDAAGKKWDRPLGYLQDGDNHMAAIAAGSDITIKTLE